MYGPVSANCGGVSEGVRIYPNPAKGKFYVEVNVAELEGGASIVLTDAKGAHIYTQPVVVQQDVNTFVIEDLNVTPGIYYLQITNGTYSTEVQKVSLR